MMESISSLLIIGKNEISYRGNVLLKRTNVPKSYILQVLLPLIIQFIILSFFRIIFQKIPVEVWTPNFSRATLLYSAQIYMWKETHSLNAFVFVTFTCKVMIFMRYYDFFDWIWLFGFFILPEKANEILFRTYKNSFFLVKTSDFFDKTIFLKTGKKQQI